MIFGKILNFEVKVANSIEPGQTTCMLRLAWFYAGGKTFWYSSMAVKELND